MVATPLERTATGFAVVFVLAEGMVRIAAGRHGEQPWSRRTARKSGVCAATGKPYQRGDEVYGPVGNQMNRADRVLASWVEER